MKFFVALVVLVLRLNTGAQVIFNTADAVRSSLGIEVVESHGLKQPSDEHSLSLRSLDPKKEKDSASLIIRGEDFKVVSIIGDVSHTVFMLKTPFLAHSYLEFKEGFVPLRLFSGVDGVAKSDGKLLKIADKEEFFTRGWRITGGWPDTKMVAGKEEKIAPRMTTEETIRSWGVNLPEGTMFYYSLGFSGIMVKSTERCLDQIEMQFRVRGIQFGPPR